MIRVNCEDSYQHNIMNGTYQGWSEKEISSSKMKPSYEQEWAVLSEWELILASCHRCRQGGCRCIPHGDGKKFL